MKKSLAGCWQFVLDKDKAGIEQQFYCQASFADTIILPTTTSEAKKGKKSTEQRIDCLTDPYHFEGYAWYLKEITISKEEAGRRFFFGMERTRKTTVWVDGQKAGHFESFYAEHRYELTQWLTPGTHRLTVLVDNTDYVIPGGHMTSPDTQTNWNGIVGELYLESVRNIAIDKMRLYPSWADRTLCLKTELSYYKSAEILALQNSSQTEVLTDGMTDQTFCLQISCRLLQLEKKEGRDFEHFEPVGMQSVQDRTTWEQQGKEQDLPYTICVLDQLPERQYPIVFREPAQTQDVSGPSLEHIESIYPLGETAREWDEYHPNVYELTAHVLCGEEVLCEQTGHFGLRDFTYKERNLYCNGREIFLRGTHDGLIFPLTGYAPMDMDSWIHVYGMAKEYGLNHYRYHTCCPPKAAFLAASYLGIYIEAELPFWGSIYDPEDEHYNEAQQTFLLEEGIRALDAFGDTPSFFGMSMGNELWGSREAINELMGRLKTYDNRHLYTQGSNNHQFVPAVLPNDDFFCGVRFSKERLFRGSYAMCDAPLGFVQTNPPGAYWDYDEKIVPRELKKNSATGSTVQIQYGTGVREVEAAGGWKEMIPYVPVISHEIGQYECTPDFDEIALYTGVLQPENLRQFQRHMQEKGLLSYAKDYFAASAKLAADCYKLELEAALRSAELSGFQLLDIKDFSGQGTALVGILNAFMKNKGAITKEKWRMFCSDAVLLPTLDSFVLQSASRVKCVLKLRCYRPETIDCTQIKVTWYLKRQAGRKSGCQEVLTQTMSCTAVSGRGLFTIGEMELVVPTCEENALYLLRFALGEEIVNEYEIFVYSQEKIKTDSSEEYSIDTQVLVTDNHQAAIEACMNGKSVLLFVQPDSVLEKNTIQGEYCTDFWCYPMFRKISEEAGKPLPIGTMGLLADSSHPALKGFATESYATAQWYQIVVHARPMILEEMAETKNLKPIVRIMDNFARCHSLGLIYEGRVHAGRILVCHVDLPKLKDRYPEAACLYRSLRQYVFSDAFAPQNRIV